MNKIIFLMIGFIIGCLSVMLSPQFVDISKLEPVYKQEFVYDKMQLDSVNLEIRKRNPNVKVYNLITKDEL